MISAIDVQSEVTNALTTAAPPTLHQKTTAMLELSSLPDLPGQ
jgi:hypothetical protein